MTTLLEAERAQALPDLLPFGGHTPRGGAVGPWVLSQWWDRAPFDIDGVTYLTAEHSMTAEKARLFEDPTALAGVLASSTPKESKAWGRRVEGFDPAVWSEVGYAAVVAGNRARFAHHPALGGFLLATGDAVLVEASPYDAVWGVALAASDPWIQLPSQRRGQNLLGLALTQVRTEMQAIL